MRALVFKDVDAVELRDVVKPSIEDAGDALIKVSTTAICGSDLHVLHGRIPGMSEGSILGHEFMGTVEAVGSAVSRFHEGDRVVASFTIPCGRCWFCNRRLFSRCPDQRVFGYGAFLGDVQGAQA
ncbi:MAG TPA: alcohol dehydrogenase catalytic domain-containing protein, partial [Dehalococcoidia bacterium]|nr:alcohol dehydrogenase catalytic domain-containing protein [Dehalococcoidia bacterium]